ncbi:NAD(P)-dependent oxidoreductase [Arenicella xantha]|uniref:Glycerate dehydrogenase n=1 Tax=Arenicella xantha TaxID=644221 RepID=A0A395JN44_9GAMM|nr:NAD(P)-dependent oxidoreductase [Arenicella xantha]RBP49314.1 glycerate dehydrogenase [Arenicella xantha]
MQTSNQLPRIVFLDQNGLPERIRIAPPPQPHEWLNYPSTKPEQILERCTGATIVLTNKVPISKAILTACPTIRHIAVTATGYNIIDIDGARSLGVSVSHVPSYAATTVSEHVIASALMLRRQLIRYRQRVIEGAWQRSSAFCVFDRPILDLKGARLGIIGMGEIGQATAQLGQALGMRVAYHSRSEHAVPYDKAEDLNSLLSSSDVLSIHCSLNDATHNLIGSKELALMPAGAILINTARGGIVNEQATLEALQQNHLGGIAFDVLVEEPPRDTSPLLSLAKHDNVIITPHTAWASEQAMQQLANTVSSNVTAFLANQALNLVS